MESIPKQYREKAEALIHEIGQLANELYPFISELGDSLEIEGDRCVIIITSKSIIKIR